METLSEKEKYYKNFFVDILRNSSNMLLETQVQND